MSSIEARNMKVESCGSKIVFHYEEYEQNYSRMIGPEDILESKFFPFPDKYNDWNTCDLVIKFKDDREDLRFEIFDIPQVEIEAMFYKSVCEACNLAK